MTLTETEINDLLANIELVWGKPVATVKNIDDYGEIIREDAFYYVDDRVFLVQYFNRTTITEYYEVTGDNLDMFKLYYKLGEYAA